MAFPSLEKSLNEVSNRYLLVVLASKRARQINRGGAPRVDSKHKKPTSVALEEIASAKVAYRVKEERETAKACGRRRKGALVRVRDLGPGQELQRVRWPG